MVKPREGIYNKKEVEDILLHVITNLAVESSFGKGFRGDWHSY